MQTIDVAYVGRGIHEELVAQVADQEGYYEDEGVHVAIRDGIGWPVERLRRGAVIGLGRTLLSRLTDGIDWKALNVNTDRPLFWFLGGTDVASMMDLRGRRLAVHAPDNPPGTFARIVLRRHGLDPDRDLACVVRHPGDYQMDLRRLRDRSIDAAYVGSALSPEQVADEEGFHVLAWVGDYFHIPTVGVSVDPARIPLDSPALQALVRANQRALRTLAEQPRRAVDYIAWFLNRLTRDEAQQYYERYIGPYFVPTARSTSTSRSKPSMRWPVNSFRRNGRRGFLSVGPTVGVRGPHAVRRTSSRTGAPRSRATRPRATRRSPWSLNPH